MCGIAGFYALKTDRSRAELHVLGQKMAATLEHRGPDAGDVWQDPDRPLVLAHRRLSIIDLSKDGAQPMESASGRYMLIYNGEFYNFRILRKELESAGIVFRGRSDTEIFLAAIELWGLNRALQKIDGMFAFALWDRQDRQLHLIRDRLGKKPLYLGWAGPHLIFGSELKALRAHPDFTAQINREALALYLQHGWTPAPHCIYENVWMLKPGHRITLNLDDLPGDLPLHTLMQPYWHPQDVIQHVQTMRLQGNEKEIIDEFETLLKNCVADRMVADVPLGAFLSGGIDSSSIVALMQSLSTQPIKTYTIGFTEQSYDEAGYAQKIATHLGTQHHSLYLSDQETLEIIPQLPEIYDEPFADISAIPTFLISQFARQSVTVALSGDGGDEMLGGYTRHVQGPRLWRNLRFVPAFLRKALAGTLQTVPTTYWDTMPGMPPQFGHKIHKASAILAGESQTGIYRRLLSHWDAPPLKHAATMPDLLEDLSLEDMKLSFAERMMIWDTLTYLPGDILTKIDRASMAASLEARAPLLDTRIFEYVWRLPESYKIHHGKGKYLLREMLARHVPRKLFERPKQGFNMPVGEWLRGGLRDWAEDLLDERTLEQQGWLDAQHVRALWQAHLNGQGHHATGLWSILMFQAWHKKWL